MAPILINAGGRAYLDGTGRQWLADCYYTGGQQSVGTTDPIAGTTADPLYQKMRYGTMSYRVPVPAGRYRVTLHFAEIYWNSAGWRMFDVRVEGGLVINNLDIWATAGKNTALTRSFAVDVSDGVLDVDFISVVDSASISAIEITPA